MARQRDYRAETRARNARARAAGFDSYYGQRISRARQAHPGISTRAARGHPAAGERSVSGLLRSIERLPAGSSVSFTGTDRQPDGTWKTARFDLFPGDGSDEQTFQVSELERLAEIRDALAATGFTVLGAQYLARMAAAVEQDFYAIRSPNGRWLSRVGKNGRAVTRRWRDERVMISEDPRRLAAYLRRNKLTRKGYAVVPL